MISSGIAFADVPTLEQYGNTVRLTQYIETLPNGRRHRILEPFAPG